MKITNIHGVPLSLAVWLVHDEYDHISDPNYISVTSLLKPIRHIILPRRIKPEDRVPLDVIDLLARTRGTALHDSIEKAWTNGHYRSLDLLGYPQNVIDRVLINPTDEELDRIKDPIPVYLEQRHIAEFEGYRIGGKYDLVAEGILHDNKSTSAFAWIAGTRDEEHQLQGSLYRWLDVQRVKLGHRPRITEDYIRINYIFTDWQKAQAASNPAYPQLPVLPKEIPLLSVEETEARIRNKLAQIKRYLTSPEDQIPECTDEELWRSAPKYKFFLDPAKATQPGARSTKNFDDMNEARQFQVEKGGKGIIVTVPSEPKRCGYCDAFAICSQKNRYFNL